MAEGERDLRTATEGDEMSNQQIRACPSGSFETSPRCILACHYLPP